MVNASGGALGATLVISIALGPQRRLRRLRRGRPRAERRLRRRGEPRHGAPQAHRPRHDARRHRPLRRRAGRHLPRRPDRRRPVRQDRPGLDRRLDLVLRALAGGAGRRHGRLRDRLRHGARHRAAQDPLDHAGRDRRRRAVDRAVARLLDLHPQLLELWRGLRRLRRGDRAAAVALPVGQRLPLRRRAQRRARAQPAATGDQASSAARPARGRSAPAGRSTGPARPGHVAHSPRCGTAATG